MLREKLIFMALLFSLISCEKEVQKEPVLFKEEPIAVKPTTVSRCPEGLPQVDVEKTEKIVKTINGSIYRIFQEAAKINTTNVLFSPVSLTSAFGMLYAGSGSDTEKEIGTAFGFTENTEALHKTLGDALTSMNCSHTETDRAEVTIANSVYVDQKFQISDELNGLLTRNYRTNMSQVDFENNATVAVQTINETIEKQTKGKIKKLFDTLDNDTVMVLTNAVYFDAKWAKPFNDALNRTGQFTLLDGSTKPQEYMEQVTKLPYIENDEVQAVKIAYKDPGYSLIMLLPKPGLYAQVEQKLSAEYYGNLTAGLKDATVKISFPKYQITERPDMDKILKEIGLSGIFDTGSNPDFSKIPKDKALAKLLHVGKVAHQATAIFDEKGTVAAAATGISMRLESLPQLPKAEKEFLVDRPFFFEIVHEPTGLILFMGGIKNPDAITE